MALLLNSEENFNEIVFENRNKEYGAYAIRKSYDVTVTKSLLITFGSICIFIIAALFFTNDTSKAPDIAGNIPVLIFDSGIEVHITPPIEKPKTKTHVKDPVPQKTQTGDLMASDDKKHLLDKTNDDFVIANSNVVKGADSAASDPVINTIVVKKPSEADILAYADEMPELKNMSAYIADNLIYPQAAVENGTSGIVYLSFVVETDGTVNDVKILRGIGDGCEQEALRVVQSMPKWKAGKNHGQPVRVLFNLPVKFRLK